jgi:hypothetical protein
MALDEEQQRVRGYLQSQAAKLSLAELSAKVRADMEQVREAAEAVPATRFAERPAEGEWSANEVMAHVVASAEGGTNAIVAVLDTGARQAAASDTIERVTAERSAAEWWSQLVGERERLFARVAQATGDEHPEVTWSHPFFGDLNWREWLLFQRIHDLDHARQMQAITAALG